MYKLCDVCANIIDKINKFLCVTLDSYISRIERVIIKNNIQPMGRSKTCDFKGNPLYAIYNVLVPPAHNIVIYRVAQK